MKRDQDQATYETTVIVFQFKLTIFSLPGKLTTKKHQQKMTVILGVFNL